jgi:hypothetical protein
VINAGLGVPNINSKLTQQGFWDKGSGSSFHFGVDFRKQFARERIIGNRVVLHPSLFAIGGGLGLSYLKSAASIEQLTETHTGTDNSVWVWQGETFFNQRYEETLIYNNVSEQLSLLYLDIPLYLEIGRPSKTKVGAWGKIGVKGSLLLSDNFTGEGTFDFTRRYPDMDNRELGMSDLVEMKDYPNGICYVNPDYDLNPFILWGTLSTGVTIPLSNTKKGIVRNSILRLGVNYDFTLNTISTGDRTNYFFPDSKFWLNEVNMLGGENGAKMQKFGLEMGVIFSM